MRKQQREAPRPLFHSCGWSASKKDRTVSAIKLLTNKQTAELLGVTTHTLDQWRWRHKGPPHVKVGGAIRYRESDLSAWIESRTEKNAGYPLPGAAGLA